MEGGQSRYEAPHHGEDRHQRRGPCQDGGDPQRGKVLLGLEREVVQEQRPPGQGGGHQAAEERVGRQPPAPVHRALQEDDELGGRQSLLIIVLIFKQLRSLFWTYSSLDYSNYIRFY